YFLYKHPEVKPRVITHFEPWMALSFTEGSIGGDSERLNPRDLQPLYGAGPGTRNGDADEFELDPSGSNGIAIAPRLAANHHALLWINPHTSFYFRSELQMVSDEGLNAYGAVTWGQFFIYQGFNATAGWMHTSSGVDNIDEFLETSHPSLRSRAITVAFKTDSGMARKTFTVTYSPRGPVVRKEGDRLVSGRRGIESPARGLSALCRDRHGRDPTGLPCAARADGEERLDGWRAHGGGVRQLSPRVRAHDPAARRGLRSDTGDRHAESEARRADRRPPGLGLSLGRRA